MLLVIIAVGLILRLISLAHAGSFWFDETFTLYFARLPWHEAWQYLQFENNPPLHFFLAHLFVLLFGGQETLLRLTSLMASIATIPIVYLLGRKLHSRPAGLLAAALFAVSGLSIFNAVEFRMYPLLILLTTGSLYYFLEYLEKGKFRTIIWLTALNIFLLLTHLTAVMFVVLQGAYLLWKKRNLLWRWLWWQAIPAVFFMVWWLPSFFNRAIEDVANSWFFSLAFDPLFFLKQLFVFLVYPTINNFPGWLITLAGFGLLLLAVRACGKIAYIKEEHRLDFFPSPLGFADLLLLLAFVPIGIGFVLNAQIPKQYSISLAPFALLLATGIIELQKEKKLSWVMIVAGCAAIVMLNYPALWRKPYALDKLVLTIEQETVPKTEILAAAHIYTLPLELYYHGSLPIKPIYFGADSGVDLMRIVRHNWHINYYSKEDLDRFLTRETKDFSKILVVGTTHWQQEGDIVKLWFMNHGWRLERTYSWDGYFNPDLHVFQKIGK